VNSYFVSFELHGTFPISTVAAGENLPQGAEPLGYTCDPLVMVSLVFEYCRTSKNFFWNIGSTEFFCFGFSRVQILKTSRNHFLNIGYTNEFLLF
jgi:hypothetical protein